jgi:hypothetical protein
MANQIVHIIPVDGSLVRMPGTNTHLPPAGADVVLDTYWRRRLADGSVKAGVAAASEENTEPVVRATTRRA